MVISVFFCIGLGIGANTASVALLARWLAELNGRVDKLEEAAKKQKTTQDRPVTEVVQHISKQFLAEASSISLNMTIHDEGPPRIGEQDASVAPAKAIRLSCRLIASLLCSQRQSHISRTIALNTRRCHQSRITALSPQSSSEVVEVCSSLESLNHGKERAIVSTLRSI